MKFERLLVCAIFCIALYEAITKEEQEKNIKYKIKNSVDANFEIIE